MRRKVIQNYADVLCHMAIGWRMEDDLEKLAELLDGSIEVNILTGRALHSQAGDLSLRIAGEMQAWLKQRLSVDRIPEDAVVRAEIRLDVRTDRIRTDKKRIVSFDWDCHSILATDERTYESQLAEAHTWHRRVQNALASKGGP
jgi:hypothetical protein